MFFTANLVPVWLMESDVPLASVGLLALTGLPYTWKILVAPWIDRWALSSLGRRHSWALVSQIGIIACLFGLAQLDPKAQIAWVGGGVFALAVCSAMQDIVLDAWRRELLRDEQLGLGSAVFVQAYRLSALLPGTLGLLLATYYPWPVVIQGLAMVLVPLAVVVAAAPEPAAGPSRGPVIDALRAPLAELRRRLTPGGGWWVVGGFLLTFKLGDAVATSLLSAMQVDLGYSKFQMATVTKFVTLGASGVGAVVGGAAMVRLGIARSLWIFGAVQSLSILAFFPLVSLPPNSWLLGAVLTVEYLGVGMGTAAFLAWIQALSSRRFAATQLALATSIMALPKSLFGAPAGWVSETYGWPVFIAGCFVLSWPGLALLPKVAPWGRQRGLPWALESTTTPSGEISSATS